MTIALLLAATLLLPDAHNTFTMRGELQGLYDEISQATLSFETPLDIEDLHAVLYTPDFVFVDAQGQQHSWPQQREDAIKALQGPPLDSITQAIKKLTPTSDGATVAVEYTTMRTIVDAEGTYGPKDHSHTLTEVTPFKDQWIRVNDAWRVKSREQTGPSKVSVDKPEYNY